MTGMAGLLTGYFILTAVVIIVLVFSLRYAKKRRALKGVSQVPPGFEPTAEIIDDPVTGRKQLVWYNARTGKRYYETLQELDNKSENK